MPLALFIDHRVIEKLIKRRRLVHQAKAFEGSCQVPGRLPTPRQIQLQLFSLQLREESTPQGGYHPGTFT